MDRIWIFHS
jgi:hypothetical protein